VARTLYLANPNHNPPRRHNNEHEDDACDDALTPTPALAAFQSRQSLDRPGATLMKELLVPEQRSDDFVERRRRL
jgi:hypothetical protein